MAEIEKEKESLDLSKNYQPDNKVHDILIEKKKSSFENKEAEKELNIETKEINENQLEKNEKDEKIETFNFDDKAKAQAEDNMVITAPATNSFYQEQLKAIDNILAEGLHEIFLQMNPEKQREFKRVGEETAVKISTLLQKAKIKADKIILLIRKWLKIIPGINQFFLEQEAKIKADKIIKLKDKI